MGYEDALPAQRVTDSSNNLFHKLMRMFTLSILVSFIGSAVGVMFVPTWMVLPLVIVEIIMLVATIFIRKSKSVSYFFTYAFCFISGITIFPSIEHYAKMGGSSLIIGAFGITTVIFAGLTLYAYFSKKDFSFLGGFLFVGLITVVGFSILGLFLGGMGGTLGLVLAGVSVLLFSGYILYDISQYRQGLTEEDIPLAVLNLYLDFINIFLNILRILSSLTK
jgi:FtsH-binding integral membrane protein